MTTRRHRWGEPQRLPYKTERECRNGCGIVKVTRHEPGEHPWHEFWRDCERIEGKGTPACEPAKVEAA